MDVSFFFPYLIGFIVGLKHRSVESPLVEAPHSRQQFPRPFDCFLLIIVSERPIAKHLKKRVVVRVPADLLEIIVFAANPDTLLRVCSADVLPLSGSEENILKLVHACVGKQKGGITVWNYRRAGNNAMAALLKETQKAL